MSEAPERIWFDATRPDLMLADPVGGQDGDVMYIRADLAGLPDDLVERIRETQNSFVGYATWAAAYDEHDKLLCDVLRWHEDQQRGEKE